MQGEAAGAPVPGAAGGARTPHAPALPAKVQLLEALKKPKDKLAEPALARALTLELGTADSTESPGTMKPEAAPKPAATAAAPAAAAAAPAGVVNSAVGKQPMFLAALEAANARRAASGAAREVAARATSCQAVYASQKAFGGSPAAAAVPQAAAAAEPHAAATAGPSADTEDVSRRNLPDTVSPAQAAPAGEPHCAPQRMLASIALEDNKRRNALSPARRFPARPTATSPGLHLTSPGASAATGASFYSGDSREGGEGDAAVDGSHAAESDVQPIKRKRGRPKKVVPPQEPPPPPESPPLKRR